MLRIIDYTRRMDTKVLIVDDSIVARMSIRSAIADCGISLREATSGEAALTLIDGGFVPVLVFLDLTMPGMGGPETLRRLCEEWPDIRVIVVTADIQQSTSQTIREAGAFDILRKPADPSLIREALERARAGR